MLKNSLRRVNVRPQGVSTSARWLQTGAVAATLVVGSGVSVTMQSSPSQAQTARTVQIDGDAVLAGRSMDPRFDKVLRAVNQYAYVVVNPAAGPEAVDGQDPDADGYAGPNPNVEDFVLRAKRLGAPTGTKILGFLPRSRGESVAPDYRRVGTDGIFLSGYTCAEATAAIATISSSWPGVVVVIGTAGCSRGAASVDTTNPGQYTVVDGSASNVASGSLDPYAGYPVAGAPKLGIPAYFTDGPTWDRLLAGIADVGAITINASDLPVIRGKIQAARVGGAKIYVYVPTGYLTKNPVNASLAFTRVATAISDPDIDGVFLDEVRSGCSNKAITDYTSMYNQVSATGKKLIYNPGQTAGSCFNAISAASVNFEGTASSFLNWPASEWGRTLGSDRIWQIVHGASSGDIPQIAALARLRNAGLVWIAANDQWTQFPEAAYFDAVRLAVRGTLTGTTSPVPSPVVSTTTTAATTTVATTTVATTTITTTVPSAVQTSTTVAAASTIAPSAVSGGSTTTASATTTTATAPTTAVSTTTSVSAVARTTTDPTQMQPPSTTVASAAAPKAAPAAAPAQALQSTAIKDVPVAPKARAGTVGGLSYTG